MKILVTGTSGFIGTWLAEKLSAEKGFEVAGFDSAEPRERFPAVHYFYGNLLDVWSSLPDVFSEFPPDAIVHMAAQARVDPSLKDPFATYDANVVGTLNLLKFAASQKPPPLFVYASSEAVYGQAERYPTKENDHFRPYNPYAASKIAADVMAQQLNARLGMRTCVLRSGMGMGPRSDPRAQVVSKFIVKALRKQPMLFPAGPVKHPTRDINPVWNFVEGVKLVLEAKAAGVYNIASGREISILEAAMKIADEVCLEEEGWPKSEGANLIQFSSDFKYREGEEGMRTMLDITKARDELGYEPRVSFEQAIAPTVRWFKQHGETYWQK